MSRFIIKNRKQLINLNPVLYNWMRRNSPKLLDKYLPSSRSDARKHTTKSLIASARQYKSRSSWAKGDKYAYAVACRRGLLDQCCAHMGASKNANHKTHTEESLVANAKQYHTKSSWLRANKSAYNAALKRGILDKCCAHMEIIRSTHTVESCKASAAKYSTRKAWSIAEHQSYKAARKQGILEVCCAHMGPPKDCRKKVICIETGRIFKSAAEASRFLGLRNGAVSRAVISGGQSGGYTWAYCDDNGNPIK